MPDINDSIQDTIAAIATAEGEGAIGVIRISGPRVSKILEGFFSPDHGPVSGLRPFRLYHGWLEADGRSIDEAMVAVMKSPKSFTGQDMAEIYSHGGCALLNLILKILLSRGARLAEPGEFTRRAFLNGKMDLTRAESVSWLISARSDREVICAARQLRGGLKDSLESIKNIIIALLARLEAGIDFDDYGEIDLSYPEIIARLEEARGGLEDILAQTRSGQLLRRGLSLVIVGKPNVGKSSILNRFLQEKRAIVSHHPGTTRDTLEEVITIAGVPLRIVDTAGIRAPRGEIEEEGVKRARHKLRHADLVLMVMDSGTRVTPEDLHVLDLLESRRTLLIVNKSDLPPRINLSAIGDALKGRRVIKISATENWGLKELQEEIAAIIRTDFRFSPGESVMVSRGRAEAVKAARDLISRAIESAGGDRGDELIAADLHQALSRINHILGEEGGGEYLAEIFSHFCVGK